MTERRRGRADQLARRRLAPLVASGRAVCHRCGLAIAPTDEWDADHVDPLVSGGSASGRVVPSHASCNRRHGAQLVNAKRRRARSRLDEWLSFFPRPAPPYTPRCPFFPPVNTAI